MPRPLGQSALMRPLVALALPGMYLVYKYNQYKRQQQEANRRKAAERELSQLNHKIDKLLTKLDEHELEMAMTQEEECVICVNAKATMQTFPCGHRVVCRKCFVKTIQVAVSQRLLPLRCVVCRAKILRLRQSRDSPFPTSVSQYSMSSMASGRVGAMPASSSLYSIGSGSSGLSGVSSVSSASSGSGGSYRGAMRGKLGMSSSHATAFASKRSPAAKKVSSRSGARSKEPLKSGGLPQIRIDEFHEPSCRPPPAAPRLPRVHIRENKVAPQEVLGRLPTIKEYGEYLSDKEITFEREKSSSTRIRCAQKLVSQIEHNSTSPSNLTRRGGSRSPSSSPSSASSSSITTVRIHGPRSSSKSPSPMPPSPSSSSSACTSAKSTPDRLPGGSRRDSSVSAASMRSAASIKSSASGKSSTSVKSSTSNKSSASGKSVSSIKSSASNKSVNSNKSSMSGRSNVSNRSSVSNKSNSSTKTVVSVKNSKSATSIKTEKNDKKREVAEKEKNDKKGKQSKGEYRLKLQKKKVDGKEYHRLQ
ncbi:uncharacterized protein LOC143020399 isoform X1 [Oratosquilla oratoria]|uniref:uncharacterized protein LOC143020399 isoform X1 n=1 Tax=Oratosquilla oratoria TaxID=337810 RepID=UPI003F759E0F